MKEILSSADTRLFSGSPFWPDRNKRVTSYATLQGDIVCDVAVIGGGITGALVAHCLVAEGFSTALVDKSRFGSGSTSASTALISYEFDSLLTKLSNQVGDKRALRSYELCFEAVSSLQQLVEEIEEPCDYDERLSVRISTDSRHLEEFEKESRIRNKHGLKVEVVDEAGLAKRFGISAPAGLICANAAQIDPLKLTASLIKASVKRGLLAFENTRITTYEAGREGVAIKTANGSIITAANVVFATGYESEKYLPERIARITTDFCFATGKIKPSEKFEQCHLVEHADNYFYASTFADRVIMGVEDPRLFRPGERARALRKKTDELIERVQPHFIGTKLGASQRWAGYFAKSKDSLPYIGGVKTMPHSIFVLGYGGNGIASSAMLAPLVIDLVHGIKSADAELFAFDR